MDLDNQPEIPGFDDEAAMAKADLYKLGKYSIKLFKMMHEGQELEAWVQAKITKAADYIASVYHYMEYEMKQSEYGEQLENADMYSESVRRSFQQKLMEAKAVNELSKKTLKSYSKKATDDLDKKAFKSGQKTGLGDTKEGEKLDYKAYNRKTGIKKAIDKMVSDDVNEGAGNTLKMKAKNRVNVANTELKKAGLSLNKQEKKDTVDKIVASGKVNPKSTYKSDYSPKKAAHDAKEYKKTQEKNASQKSENVEEAKMVGNTPWKEVPPEHIAALIKKYFETHRTNVATVDLARWLHHNHRIGVGDVDSVRRNVDRMLAKKEFHYLNPQRLFGLRDRY